MLKLVPPPTGPTMIQPKDLKHSFPYFLKTGLQWLGKETIFGLDVFMRVAATVMVLRGINWLVMSVGSKSLWDDHGDALLNTFQTSPNSKAAPEPDLDSRPLLLFEFQGFRFFRHTDVFQGQMLGPCPLREVSPCARCNWFVAGSNGGRSWCAAQTKVRLAEHPEWKSRDLWDIKEELDRQYGTAATRAGVS